MREIEFRAWNDEKLTMVHAILFENESSRIIDERGFDLMQFTGLRDKDGVKIFEGDIVQIGKTSRHMLKVEFINAYVGGWVLTHEDPSKWLSLGAREVYELTVVGSIHENPGLLQGGA